jgi:hypothetical protein
LSRETWRLDKNFPRTNDFSEGGPASRWGFRIPACLGWGVDIGHETMTSMGSLLPKSDFFHDVNRDFTLTLLHKMIALRLPNWPMPRLMDNRGNFVGSLGARARWLAAPADASAVPCITWPRQGRRVRRARQT